MLNLIDVLAILLTIISILGIWATRRTTLPLPPGPRGYPIIGNLFDMPSKHEWLTFAKWGKMYGDLCSVTIGHTTIIIINSYQDALTLLDRKGAIYLNRPRLVMINEMLGFGKSTMLTNGDLWKAQRTLMQQEIGTHRRLNKYQVNQQEHMHVFLQSLVISPEKLKEHISHHTAGVILDIAYGYKVEQDNDPLICLFNEAMDFMNVASTGAFLVDYIPILKYIPSWFPGADFQKFATHGQGLVYRMVNEPYDFVKRQMAGGRAQESFTSSQISAGTSEELVKWTAVSMFAAGSETTISFIHSFFHAMVLNPDVQEKAQDEIDAILGPNTLPTMADKDSLPYMNALLKEVLRFHPVGPMGIPHYTVGNDIHNGYFIPKNSIVFANIWQMCHDPNIYKDPMMFNPSRFLGDSPELDPHDIAFGFGRRLCAGQLLAEASTYLLCTSALAVFDIAPVTDNARKPILPAYEYTSGFTSEPVPFQCVIEPRSSKALSLIMD